MGKILYLLLVMIFMAETSFAINDWKQGNNTAPVEGTLNASDIDYAVSNYLADPLDKVLTEYIHGCTLTRTSATVVTISVGEVVCYNGAKTIKRMRRNTATATVDMTVVGVGGIDSGSVEAVSTWYDVYAVADASATTFTVICAQQGTALSDVTYYRYIGSFYNNAASDISNFYYFGKGQIVLFMWDVPVELTTVSSGGAWSAATACQMPSSSTLGIFGGSTSDAAGFSASLYIRPNGTTWNTDQEDALAWYNGGDMATVVGNRICLTDSSQQIQYFNGAGDSIAINQEGFYINR